MKSFIAALRSLVLPYGRTSGRRLVLDGDNGQILVYDAADQLVVSLTSADPPGLLVGSDSGRQVQINNVGNEGRILLHANSPAAFTASKIVSAVFGEGTPTENVSLQFQGPAVDVFTDRLELLISSQNADGSSQANLILRVAGAEALWTVDRVAGTTLHGRVQVTPSGRIVATPSGSTSPLVQVDAPLSQTGPLARWRVDTETRLSLSADGEITTYRGNTFQSWTPTVTNGGSATFTTQTGIYQRIGKKVSVLINLVVGAAGSGAGLVGVSLPTTPDRSLRQALHMHTESVGPNGSHIGNGSAVWFAGGSGATSDRLRTSSNDATNRDLNITGADLLAGGTIVISGDYYESVGV